VLSALLADMEFKLTLFVYSIPSIIPVSLLLALGHRTVMPFSAK